MSLLRRSVSAPMAFLGLLTGIFLLGGCVASAPATKSEVPQGTLMNVPSSGGSTQVAAPATAPRLDPPPVSQAAAAASFDYYVLALSWSPEYCAGKGGGAKSKVQCVSEPKRGFVVHGLWPQFAAGGYPESCAKPAPVPTNVMNVTMEIMPDEGLIRHEWAKHGTCTGETPDNYFADVWAAWERLTLPGELRSPPKGFTAPASAVRQALVALNPLLPTQSVVLECQRGRLSEVRICLDKALNPRVCGTDVVDTCGPSARILAH